MWAGRKVTVMAVTAEAGMESRREQVWSAAEETPVTLLDELPEELLLAVFSHLDGRDLLVVSCVCSLFRRLTLGEDAYRNLLLLSGTWEAVVTGSIPFSWLLLSRS